MKTTLAILFTMITISANAQVGGVGGGGDVGCENRIRDIIKDIQDWITLGGSSQLDFTSLTRVKHTVENGLTKREIVDLTVDGYNENMLEVTKPIVARENGATIIECTSDPVKVSKIEKACSGFLDTETLRWKIQCAYDRFRGLSVEEQYRQTHHELAGLATVEHNNGDQSDYRISDQLSAFLEEITVKKLSIKKVIHKSPLKAQRLECQVPAIGLTFTKYTEADFDHDLKIRNTSEANYIANIQERKKYADQYGFLGEIEKIDLKHSNTSTRIQYRAEFDIGNAFPFNFQEECTVDWFNGDFYTAQMTKTSQNGYSIGKERKYNMYCAYVPDLYDDGHGTTNPLFPIVQMNFQKIEKILPKHCALDEEPLDRADPKFNPFKNFTEAKYIKARKLFNHVFDQVTEEDIKAYMNRKKQK